MTALSFLSAFNAKAMSYEQVADSFVSSPKFAQLAGQWNALLVGPRGSGKTTLLRMLSLEGLRSWSGPEADAYRANLNYTGIYVPSDIAWGEMINSLGDGMDKTCFNLIAEAAFATNVMIATVSAMQLRLQSVSSVEDRHRYRAVQIASCDLEEVVREIAELWKLQPRTASLRSLQLALSARLLHIGQQSTLFRAGGSYSEALVRDLMPYIGLPIIQCVNEAVIAFDARIDQSDGIWTLLLDEFEVAPDNLQRMILTALRASARKLLFKVALAPCGPHTLLNLDTGTPPTERNDFRQIELWYSDKGEAEAFCADVFAARTSKEPKLAACKPEAVFGKSAYAIVDEDGQTNVASASESKNEQLAREFAALREKDPSFDAFLTHKKISLDKLDTSPDAPNGNTIRKIAPIVAFRNAYKGYADGKKRGRKPFTSAYSGWAAIAAMSEGNPRWLIGMLTGIFSEVGTSDSLPVSIQRQQHHALVTAKTFADVLGTVAIRQFDQIQTSIPVFQLLSMIGKYFYDRLVVDEFQEDPPLSFYVDDDIGDDIENCLRIAINHGAIVCYQSADDIGGFGTLCNKRFRLSYLLAPVFKLPVRKSKAVKLSTALAVAAARGTRHNALPASDYGEPQGTLF
jgi:hypothetical protein